MQLTQKLQERLDFIFDSIERLTINSIAFADGEIAPNSRIFENITQVDNEGVDA